VSGFDVDDDDDDDGGGQLVARFFFVFGSALLFLLLLLRVFVMLLMQLGQTVVKTRLLGPASQQNCDAAHPGYVTRGSIVSSFPAPLLTC
jgi:hypothetical protein